MDNHPETILADLMKKKPIRRRVAKMNNRDLLQICAAIEWFNQLTGLPSLRWEDTVRIAEADRGRQ